MLRKAKQNMNVLAGMLFVFAASLIFYYIVNPMIPFDADDWIYLGEFRTYPIPMLWSWNPSRILPEFLMPIMGYLGAFIIYPITGNYIDSISLATALLLALFLSGLYLSVYRLFRALHSNKNICTLLGIFVVALCFALFKSDPSGNNPYLFYSNTLCTYFYYTLPNILGSILICIFMRSLIIHKKVTIEKFTLKSGLLIVMIYFTVFSIQFTAFFLASFFVLITLHRLFCHFSRSKDKFLTKCKTFCVDMIKHNNVALIVIAGVLIALAAEYTGGRANWDNGKTHFGSIFSGEFFVRIGKTAKEFFSLLPAVNKIILLIIAAILVLTGIAYLIRRKKDSKTDIVRLGKLCLLTCVPLLLLCLVLLAKAGISGGRIDAVYGVFFLLILFVALAALYLIKTIKITVLIFPLIVVFTVLIAVNSSWPYANQDNFYGEFSQRKAFMNELIEQVSTADREGESEITLYVPKYEVHYNWPIAVDWWGGELSDALYNHNITSKRMNILIEIDENISLN